MVLLGAKSCGCTQPSHFLEALLHGPRKPCLYQEPWLLHFKVE